jgi:hypothetical protein
MEKIEASKSFGYGGVTMIATAIGVVAVGAFAIGALAIGRLAIRHIAVERAKFKSLDQAAGQYQSQDRLMSG